MRKISVTVMLLMAFIFLGLMVTSCSEDPRQAASRVVFDPLPTPRLEEAQRLIQEQLKKEAAEAEVKKTVKKATRQLRQPN